MSRHGILSVAAAGLCTALWAYACGDGATEPPTSPPDPPRPATVAVVPATVQLTALDATVQLTAEVRDQNGQAMAGATVTWASSAPAVATVNSAGLVRGVSEGAAMITAMAGDALGTSEITVANPDRAALVALYEATDGPNWLNSHNWLSEAPLHAWHGVRTERERVAEVHLAANGLSGQIPVVLANLSNLRKLVLDSNQLTGPIPSELVSLVHLRELWLTANRLSGPVPSELGDLASLTVLALSDNQLTGPIPPELGDLASLTVLALSDNQLTGPIPPELGDLASLAELWLGLNGLTGTIPPELGDLRALTGLYVSGNQLVGPIPPGLRDLDKLTSLQMNRNDGLCVPGTRSWVDWVGGLGHYLGTHCNDSDITVLKSLYETAHGRSWSRSDAWNGSAALAEWYGVTADSLGHVVALDLSRNELSGRLPSTLGALTQMTELRIGGNALRGRLPHSLADVALRELHYADTGLCYPTDESFRQWLNGIASHTGTGVGCSASSERDVLVEIYDALGGPDWADNRNWLTEAPLGDWHGVEVDKQGRVVGLHFYQNRLRGAIPPVLGTLSGLVSLELAGNGRLTGPIPSELGELDNLEDLDLSWNHLRSPIPPELGNLTKLRSLNLELARLRGSIPPEIGRLTDLESLNLSRNAVDEGTLGGAIPPELGNLANLARLDLGENDLTDAIPDEIGRLANLRALDLSQNDLEGPIPDKLYDLGKLQHLDLSGNALSGPISNEIGRLRELNHLNLSDNRHDGGIPAAIGNLVRLEYLWMDRVGLEGGVPPQLGVLEHLREVRLTGNAAMAGALPVELTGLHHLEALLAGGTALCAPTEARFVAWLQRVPKRRIVLCAREVADAYLTQAVQSRDFPVPLVAGEAALLRVFVTAAEPTQANIPDVRATFYSNGTETYAATIPSKSGPIPTSVYEGSLRLSANIEIPGWVVAPGLEAVIEIDPEGTLDAGLGVARRIPESGRMAVDVQAVPPLDLTLVPFVVTTDPDTSIARLTLEMAADPENHEALRSIRDLMPVADLRVTAHAPVETSTDDKHKLLRQTELIRVAEGGAGHYMGLLPYFVGGVAYLGGKSSFSDTSPGLMAHEIGHNFNLLHAPCPPGINNPDPSFPHPYGRIGVWGYDFRAGRLVRPTTGDVMGYCGYDWPSDYHFTNALRYRLFDEGASAMAAPTRSLLLWGGVDHESNLFLEPAFVMDAAPALPDSIGEYLLAGRSAAGEELFRLQFSMPTVTDGDGGSFFVFALPIRPGWEHNLSEITLSRPDAVVSLTTETARPMTILRNGRTGQVRAILRDPLPPARAAMDAAGKGGGPGLKVLFSRGIPDPAAWRR